VTGSSAIPSSPEAMAAGNVVFGGIIGLGVDAASGAINKYPDQITVAMIPDRSCRQSPRTSSRTKPQETPEQ
jgi:phosphoketolase